MLDQDGYPTEEALEALDAFEGTLNDYLEEINKNWSSYGFAQTVIDDTNDTLRLELVTGGWSGNEEVISHLEDSMFWFLNWNSSHRGGLFTFKFPQSDLARVFHWGSFKMLKPKLAE